LGTPAPISGPSSVCSDVATGLSYSVPAVGGASSYAWTISPSGNGTIVSQTGNSITADLTGNATISVVPSTASGLNTCGSASTSVTINAAYTGNELLTADQIVICEGQTATVFVAPPAAGATYTNWSVPAGASVLSTGTNGTSALIQFGQLGGNITVQASHPCLVGTRTIGPVSIDVRTLPVANAGADQELDGNMETSLDGTGSTSGLGITYSWTSANGSILLTPTEVATITTPSDIENTYTLTVAYQGINGCASSDEVVVVVKYKVKVPNAFSPNGDNNHDVVVIENIEFFPNAKIEIYSQWGELVYKTDDPFNQPWNGKRNNTGADMEVSAYYYVLDLNQAGMKPMSGHINLIK
jgi:gliding motility-associated-like protein